MSDPRAEACLYRGLLAPEACLPEARVQVYIMIAPETTSDGLIPISLATLPVSSVVEVDVFLKPRSNERAVLLCAAGQCVERYRFEELVQEGVSRLYIHSNDRRVYQRRLRESLDTLLLDDARPVLDRATIMHEVIRDVLCDEFAHGSTESIVDACQQFGRNAAQLMAHESVVLKELCRVMHHDYGTFTHSANVSAYSVKLAGALGFTGADLELISIGGLLHDLGKLAIDECILNKPGKLDENERKVIETHPTIGLSRLVEREDLSEGEMMMIYQHHERIDGSGYPVGVTGDEIHPWARVCAVVDVFEALTSHRPYRPRLSTQTAMAVLEKNSGREFDKEMVSCWRQLMQD